ncbi:MAG: hypothetical protein PHS88_11070, partial [Candidatus Omnitrophica bacterium]|nr:hypothetical protein [Candidatus Omnitrophota bacterium]
MLRLAKIQFSYKQLFILLSLAALGIMPLLSLGYGITFDEWMDSNNGMLTLRHILNPGDQSFMEFWHGYLYSQLFYVTVGTVYGLLHGNLALLAQNGLLQEAHLIPFFTTSHIINSLFGFLGILYTGLLAKRIGGWRAGCLAFLFLALSPRYLGNAMNDPKDIPFAAAHIFAVYYLIRFLDDLPKIRFKTSLLLTLGISAVIGTRIGGMIQINYLFLFSALTYLYLRWIKRNPQMKFWKLALAVTGISIAGYLGGIFFWPYGQSNPLVHPFEAIKEVSNFRFWEGLLLFDGKLILSTHLPWDYIPKWILISSPLYFVLALILFLILLKPFIQTYRLRLWLPLLFISLFPIVFVILKKSMLLDSWRHLLFVYPPLVVLAALVWEYLLRYAHSGAKKLLVWSIILFHLSLPLGWMIKNHPNAYVYFNELVGGINGAFGRYETDYWGNSLRAASEWLVRYHNSHAPSAPAIVRADGHFMSSYAYLKKGLGNRYHPAGYPKDLLKKDPFTYVGYAPYLGGHPEWDYALVLSRGWSPEILRSLAWPPIGTIYTVKADDVVLCAVVKNPKRPSPP